MIAARVHDLNFTQARPTFIWIDFGQPLRARHTPVQPATTSLGCGRRMSKPTNNIPIRADTTSICMIT